MNRSRLGAIGVGNRASLLLQQLPESAKIVALSDCNLPRAEAFKAKMKGDWPVYQDYRKILDRKDIDAVIVATGEFQPSCALYPCLPGWARMSTREKPLTLVHSRRAGAGQRGASLQPRSSGGDPATLDGDEPRGLRTGSNGWTGEDP